MRVITPLTRLQKTGANWLRAFACACVTVTPVSVLAVTPVNTEITNIAKATYEVNGVERTEQDSARFVTEQIFPGSVAPTEATIEIKHFQSAGGGSQSTPITNSACATSAAADSFTEQTSFTQLGDAAPHNIPGNYQLADSQFGFKVGEPLFIQVTEADKNLNPLRNDEITVTVTNTKGSDQETIRLSETDINTGVFVGFIQTRLNTPQSYDCALTLDRNDRLQVSYIDANDNTDSVSLQTRFDPYSRIFNSQTGTPIDGIKVTLIDTNTGKPAQGKVLDDNAAVCYQNAFISGQGPTDAVAGQPSCPSSTQNLMTLNNQEDVPAGSFRFPFVRPGSYQLQFEAPVDLRVPSKRSNDELSEVPSNTDNPFRLTEISRGQPFVIQQNIFIADVPVDIRTSGALVTKSASKNEVGIGDFLQYSIVLKNNEVEITDGKIIDQLPSGLRFQPGSVQLNSQKIADPVISGNAQQLTFDIGNIAEEQSVTLSYVTQVTNLAKGELINKAWLEDDNVSSNIAQARVLIRDDFFKDTSRLFGRVYLDDCNGNLDAEAVSNVRLYMEDGTYVVTDESGEWHIEDVRPGTHVVQLDTSTIPPYMEAVACDNRGFHAGRAYSQFVDVQPGSFWRVDFALKVKEPEKGEVRQRLSHQLVPLSTLADGSMPYNSPVPEKLKFTLDIDGSGLDIFNLMEMIALPDGVIYEPGSSVLDNVPWEDPRITYGTLIYKLGDKPKEWQHQLQFTAVVSDKAKSGILETKAITRFNVKGKSTQQIKPASTTAVLQLPPDDGVVKPIKPPKFDNFSDVLTLQDKTNLKSVIDRLVGLRNLKVEVVGHTDSTPIARRNRHIFENNQVLSEARAKSVAEYVAAELGVTQEQVIFTGRGATRPVASNATRNGRALNRRVEVKVLSGDPDIQLASIDSDIQVASVQTDIEGFLSDLPATASGNPAALPVEPLMPEFDDNWFNSAADNAQWLWPPLDRSPSIGSVKIAISHQKGQRIKLLLDNKPVSPLNFDGVVKGRQRDLAVSTWRGVDIEPGPNRFSVFVIDKDGDIISQFNRTVQYAQDPAKAELVEDQSSAIADGITPAVIAVKLTDKDGFPIRADVQGELEIQAPYQLYDKNAEIEANPLGRTTKPRYRIGADGIALIRLAPTSTSGEAVLRFRHNNGQQDELRIWMQAPKRDWILVGLGDLAVGYNAGGGDSAGRKAEGIDDNIYHDGRLAFFTQGQIPGDWLITAAYDSGKPEAEAFARTIEPNRYYTLYGDASQQRLDASSAKKLYVKIERERFYALFGDINTDLTVTELGRYSRKMTGAQTAYQGEVFEFSAFAAESDNGYARDEIQGDGTSGLYRFSNQQLVANSEKIHLEIRDRFRSEIVISRQELQRDSDYVIDYQDGTVYFKQPILSTDDSFNPRFIIAEYDVDQGGELGHIAGGRAGIKLLDNTVKAGVTVIKQNQQGDGRALQAADVKLKLGNTEIKAETAFSDRMVEGEKTSAKAHLLEATHRTDNIEAKAYVRRQEENFGVDQSSSAENDFRKEGIEGTWYLSDRDRLKLNAFHHYKISTGDDKYQTQLDWIHRLNSDQQFSFGALSSAEENEGSDLYSDQLTAGFSNRFFNDRITLNAQLLARISARSDAKDQLRLGADYRINNDYSVFGEHELGFEKNAPQRTIIGLRATPWAGAKAQQSIEQVKQDDAYRLFSVSGLSQEFPITDVLSLSAGFDQARNLETNAPSEVGQNSEDFYAVYAGSALRTSIWQWNNRLEFRDGNNTDKWTARTSIYHPLSDAIATGGSLDYFHSENKDKYSKKLDAKFDLAIRPRKDPYALLLQTRWVQEADGGQGTPARSRRLINNAHVNWLITARDQLAAQYGIKRVLDQYNSNDYAATTDFIAAEWRHHLNDRWDLGAHARRLHGYQVNQTQQGYGVSVGWIPKTNVWLGLGYNFSGFVDDDFSAANFTAQGVYLKMRFKADQETLQTLRAAFQ